MGGFVVLIVLFGLVGLLGIFLVIGDEVEGEVLFLPLLCGLAIWATIEHKTTYWATPSEVAQTELSILMDDEIAIIRYDGENHEYTNVQKYNAIKDGKFKFMRTKEFDITGEDNGSTYELVLTEKKK